MRMDGFRRDITRLKYIAVAAPRPETFGRGHSIAYRPGDRARVDGHDRPMDEREIDGDELAARIVAARRTGTELADAPRLTLGQGYAVQARVAAGLGRAAGWKVGATSTGAQRFLGVTAPICGRVLADGVTRSGERVSPPGDRAAEAEPEILLRLSDEPGEDPASAVAAVHLGLEINRPSRADALELGAGFIVADNAAHAGLVVGPAIPLDALARPDAIRVRLFRDGELAAEGDAAAVLGDPLEALRWLARARPLRAGDWVATGAITRSCPLAIGDRIEADFGRWGRVEVGR